MRDFFSRLNWQTVFAFSWFCTCVVYAITHVPPETWEKIATVDIYALCAGIAALVGATASFFRGELVRPKPAVTIEEEVTWTEKK